MFGIYFRMNIQVLKVGFTELLMREIGYYTTTDYQSRIGQN